MYYYYVPVWVLWWSGVPALSGKIVLILLQWHSHCPSSSRACGGNPAPDPPSRRYRPPYTLSGFLVRCPRDGGTFQAPLCLRLGLSKIRGAHQGNHKKKQLEGNRGAPTSARKSRMVNWLFRHQFLSVPSAHRIFCWVSHTGYALRRCSRVCVLCGHPTLSGGQVLSLFVQCRY